MTEEICAKCGYEESEHYHLTDGVYCPRYVKELGLPFEKFKPQNHSPQDTNQSSTPDEVVSKIKTEDTEPPSEEGSGSGSLSDKRKEYSMPKGDELQRTKVRTRKMLARRVGLEKSRSVARIENTNLSDWIYKVPHGEAVRVERIKEAVKKLKDEDEDLFMLVMGRLSSGVEDIGLIANLILKDFKLHKKNRDKIFGEALING